MLDVNWEHPYKGFEQMLAQEVPVSRLRSFVQGLVASGVDAAHYGISGTLPADDAAMLKLVQQLLSARKAQGGRLVFSKNASRTSCHDGGRILALDLWLLSGADCDSDYASVRLPVRRARLLHRHSRPPIPPPAPPTSRSRTAGPSGRMETRRHEHLSRTAKATRL